MVYGAALEKRSRLWRAWVRIPPSPLFTPCLYALAYSISRYCFSPRRGAGVADQARLESACRLLVTVGSNPTLSAFFNLDDCRETAEIVSINSPISPQSWGTSKSGGHPQTPARGISLWTPFTTPPIPAFPITHHNWHHCEPSPFVIL